MQLLKIEKMDQPISGYDYNIKFLSGENVENLYYTGNGKFLQGKDMAALFLDGAIKNRMKDFRAAVEDYYMYKHENDDPEWMEIRKVLFGSIENYNKRTMEIMKKEYKTAMEEYLKIKLYEINLQQL